MIGYKVLTSETPAISNPDFKVWKRKYSWCNGAALWTREWRYYCAKL